MKWHKVGAGRESDNGRWRIEHGGPKPAWTLYAWAGGWQFAASFYLLRKAKVWAEAHEVKP
jgi:hypothetical protein